MRAISRLGAILAGAGLLAAAPALAEMLEELPLDRGFYVRTDETCATASNAGAAVLRRAGLQWVTSQCVFESIERTGPTSFTVVQTCGDAAHSERAVAAWEIPDRSSFSFADSNGWSHAARLCAQAEMPAAWRDIDLSALID